MANHEDDVVKQYPKLPSVERAEPKMSAAERAAHAAMLPTLDTFRQRKDFWCGERHRMMPPTVLAEDGAGKLVLEVVVQNPSLPAGHDGPTSARDGALVVADRVIRGLGATRVLVAWDMYHYVERLDGDERHEWGRGSMQEAHRDGSAAARGVSEALGIYALDRSGRFTGSTLPFEWDVNTPETPPQWFPASEFTFIAGDSAGFEGVIHDVLTAAMKSPLFAATPEFREGVLRVSRANNVQPPPESEWQTMVARSTLQVLATEYGCALVIPADHPFGPDIEGLIARAAGVAESVRGAAGASSQPPRTRTRDGRPPRAPGNRPWRH